MTPNKPKSVLDFEQAQAHKLVLAAAIVGTMPWTLTAVWELVQLVYTLYEAYDGAQTVWDTIQTLIPPNTPL